MTDQELIALLDERRLQDWTAEEIALLRERIRTSPEVRAAVQSELRLEQGLQAQLGGYGVPVDLIISRASGKSGWKLGLLMGWTAAAIAIGVGVLYWNVVRKPEVAKIEATSDATASATSDATASATATSGAATAEATNVPAEPTGTPEANPMGSDSATPTPTPREGPRPAPEVAVVLRDAELFEDFVRQRVPPSEDELKKLITPAPGANVRYFGGPDRAGAGFEGQTQLRIPNDKWPTGGTLRVAFYDVHRFKMFAWSGLDGAAFYHHENDPHRWSGFATTRERVQDVKPKRLTSAGTDDNRWQRLGDGWIDLRYEDGRFKLCRSDVVLLDVPLAEPPTQLFFDGHAVIRAIEWVSVPPASPSVVLATQTIHRNIKPERLPWQTRLSGDAKFVADESGAMLLSTSSKNPEDVHAGSVLERAGMYAVDFLVEDPQPGSGVFLGDGAGNPIVKLGFLRDRRTGSVVFQWCSPWDTHLETEFDSNHQAVPFAGKQQRLRLVVGANLVRCFASVDGQTWGSILDPYRQQNHGNLPLGGFISSGVYLLRGETPRSIKLREMSVVEPTSLRDAGGFDAAEQALAFAFASDAGEWLKLVSQSKPVGHDDVAWRCACAYKTIAHSNNSKLITALWSGLIEDSLQLAPTIDDKLAVLYAATLATPASEPQEANLWFARYEKVGRELARVGDPAPWSRLRLAMIFCPLYSRGLFDVEPASLARQELLQLVSAQDWTGVKELCRRIRVMNQPVHPHQRPRQDRKSLLDLTDWCDAVASRSLPRQAGETIALSVDWRRPLVEQLSKEGYNLLAEFEAALKSKSYKDACQIVASSSPGAALGVAPDSQDPALLVSLPSAVALAMRDAPELQRAMEKEYGPIGKFRIKAATLEGDASAVEAATVQFFGTAAAADAHIWLGDRALATGDFAAAGSQYRRAAETLGDRQSPTLEARRRLAAAFQSREYGAPPTTPIAVGDQTLSAQQFEALVTAARGRSERSLAFADVSSASTTTAPPPPAEYGMKPFAQTSGDYGRENERSATKDFDAYARTITTLVNDKLFITHNRFQTIAFDLGSGEQKWSTGLGNDQGQAHKWRTPMRPIIVDGKLIVRRLKESGPQLAAIELESGKVLWQQQPGHHVASDPFWIQQELFALVVTGVGADQLQLELVSFALDSGEPLARRKLALFRNAWNSAIPCAASASGDRIVAAVGGAVVCTDLLGQVLWMREQVWIPSKQDESADHLGMSPPVIAEGRVYISQPNVRTIDCLDLDGGRLQWRRTYESLQRLVGLAGEKRDVLIAALDDGIEAISLADGQSLWRRTENLDAEGTVAGSDSVLAVERAPVNNDRHRVRLVWLDPPTGKELAASLLSGVDELKPDGPWPQFAPVVASGGRYWGYFNGDEKTPKRRIVELTSLGPPPSPGPVDTGAARYAQTSARLSSEAAGFSPGWLLAASPDHPQSGRQRNWEGRPNVMLTLCRHEGSTSWGGLVTLSGEKPAKLKIDVAHVRDQPFRLVVEGAGKTLADWIVSPETAPSHWATLEADLSSIAGRTTWLEVRQEPIQGREAFAAWQSIQIVSP